MLKIEVENFKGFYDVLEDMEKQLAEVPKELYHELDEWQTEDVRFKKPYTEMVDEYTAETIIWPKGTSTFL